MVDNLGMTLDRDVLRQANIEAKDEIAELRRLVAFLSSKFELEADEILSLADDSLPLMVFAQGLPPLEALVRYMKDERGNTISEVAAILNRSPKTIWHSYRQSLTQPFHQSRSAGPNIPLRIFHDRRFSILEAVCHYLKEKKGWSNIRISRELNRDTRTVWTVLSRHRKKYIGGTS